MTHRTLTVPVLKLYLDERNARHDDLDNEAEIIDTLFSREKAGEIAKSIAEVGELNPLERVGVIKHPKVAGAFIVVEGNRRVAALKMLHDPGKAPAKFAKQIQKHRNTKVAIPTKIEVVLFDSWKEAAPWIDTRHKGEDGGRGLRPWGTREKAKHAARFDGKTANSLAVELLAYAAKRGLVSQEEADAVAPTTLTRYLNTPLVRHVIGLTSAQDFAIDVPEADFERTLQTVLRDALPDKPGSTPKVHSRSSSDDRKAYAKNLEKAGHVKTTRTKKPTPMSAAKAKSAAKKRGPRLKDHDNRPLIVPNEFKYSFAHDKVLGRIFKELRDIDAERFPFSANYLLRAFVERILHNYAKAHSLSHDDRLHKMIESVEKHLHGRATVVAAIGKKAFDHATKVLRVMAHSPDSAISPETLGASVHGGLIPSRVGTIKKWDEMEPALKIILDHA